MAVNHGKDIAGKQNVKMPIVIACVVALIAFMVWYGIRTFGPEPDKKTEAGMANDNWLDKIAKESGGDVSKLSLADLEKLNKQTFGHAQQALQARAKELGAAK